MVAGNYFFRPNHVLVRVNMPVEITIWETGGMIPHNFVLKSAEAEINIEQELGTGPKKIRFTPRTVGKFPFYCSGGLIEAHREMGMEGILEVTEPPRGKAASSS